MSTPVWEEIALSDLSFNPFTLIGSEWMLVCAGDEKEHNALTASWGGLGVLWNKNVAFTFIRPQRYTLRFMEDQSHYSLNFFENTYRSALTYFGTHSGRDGDKDKETGLHALTDQAAPYYEEARMVMICKKLSMQQMDPACFIDPTIDEKQYPQKDYHQVFVGEIEKILLKK